MFAHIRCLKTILVRMTPALATARAISSTSKSTNHAKNTECIKCRHLETHAPVYKSCIHILRYITGKFIKSEDRWKLTLNLFWLKFCHPETTIISQYFTKKSTVYKCFRPECNLKFECRHILLCKSCCMRWPRGLFTEIVHYFCDCYSA